MLNKVGISCGLLLAFVLSTPLYAQESGDEQGVSIDITGALQSRVTYGQTSDEGEEVDRLGFGIRRGRVDINVAVNDKFGINYDFDLGQGRAATLDLFGFYKVNQNVSVRFGIFTPPQPRAHIFTSFTKLDGVERAAIAENWAVSGIGGAGRDFGADVSLTKDNTLLIFGIHNGRGNFAQENFSPSFLGLNNRTSRPLGEMAISTYLNHILSPGLEIGGYASYNGAQNSATATSSTTPGRNYVSWSSHLYWGAHPGDQPIRLKLDLIGMHFQSSTTPNNAEDVIGISGTVAVQAFEFGEVYARLENLDATLDQNFLSAGVHYSLSARKGGPFHKNRLTLAFAQNFNADAGLIDKHFLVLQSQIVF